LSPVIDGLNSRENEEKEQELDDLTDIATDGVEDVIIIIRLSDQDQAQPEIGIAISL